jgi:hypothetical protein
MGQLDRLNIGHNPESFPLSREQDIRNNKLLHCIWPPCILMFVFVPRLLDVCAKTAGCFNNKASNYHWEQMPSILKDTSAMGSAKGHSTDDMSPFVERILTAISPGSGSIEETPSLVDTSKAIGLSKSTTRQKLKVTILKQNSLVGHY